MGGFEITFDLVAAVFDGTVLFGNQLILRRAAYRSTRFACPDGPVF